MSCAICLLGSPQAGAVMFRADMRFQLLAYLAYRQDWVSRNELANLFWSETSTEVARHNLRQLIKRLKLFSFPQRLEIERERLRWQVSTDVAAFRKAVSEKNFSQALACYSGDFLQGLESGEANEFHSWLFNERETLKVKWRETILEYAQQAEKPEAIRLLERLLDLDPLDEEAVQLSLGLFAEMGQLPKAVSTYRTFARRLEHELGLSPTSTTQNLFQHIQEKHTISVSQRDISNLMPAHNTLIGRDVELSDLAYLLSQPTCKIITLTGPGGIGKTSLAMQAAQDNRASFDQIYVIPLEAVKSVSGVPLKMAEVCNVALQPSKSVVEQLAEVLKDKRVMLLLDNIEHVLDSAPFVSALAASCPYLKILVTSRERLNLEEEHLLMVSGLALPKVNHTRDEALGTASAKLFIERARRVHLHFEVSHQELPYLVNLCQKLGGIPLALELAAVWVRMMSLKEIDQELAKSLDLLESQSRSRPERHRSLRAVFRHTWALLNQKQQTALKQVSVFRGGFTREAANLVANVHVVLLASLVDKSLLRRTDERFDFHPLVHEYISETCDPLELQTTYDAHSRYYQHFLSTYQTQPEHLRAVYKEWDNVHSALVRSISGSHALNLSDLLRWVDLMDSLYDLRGAHQEGLEFLLKAEQRLDEKKPQESIVLARVLIEQGWCHYWLGDYSAAKAVICRAFSLFQDEDRWRLRGLNTLGLVALNQADITQAKGYFEEALELARKTAYEIYIAHLVGNLGIVADFEEDVEAAMRYHQESLRRYQDLRNHQGVVREQINVGTLYLNGRNWDKARELLQQALSLALAVSYKQGEAYVRSVLSRVYYELQDLPESYQLALEALQLALEIRDKHLQTTCHAYLTLITADLNQVEESLHYIHQTINLSRVVNTPWFSMTAAIAFAKLAHYADNTSGVRALLQKIVNYSVVMPLDMYHARVLGQQVLFEVNLLENQDQVILQDLEQILLNSHPARYTG